MQHECIRPYSKYIRNLCLRKRKEEMHKKGNYRISVAEGKLRDAVYKGMGIKHGNLQNRSKN